MNAVDEDRASNAKVDLQLPRVSMIDTAGDSANGTAGELVGAAQADAHHGTDTRRAHGEGLAGSTPS
ncbi:hypothetical protein [Variovorax gossypii]|jgi:hypothetical protein|uniref:hypothetical protein n=1 Tax=uncultured Variovorax sp. TaxID=114708 RepID=UPI00262214DE|nr:hypothetical protein [uncultured Variovorax sp.]